MHAVEIFNRHDQGPGSRLADFEILVGHTPGVDNATVCASHSGTAGSNITLLCADDTRGRYVHVQLRGKGPLTLCEVRVFAPSQPGHHPIHPALPSNNMCII